VFSFTPWKINNQEKGPRYPFDRRVGEPKSRSGRGGEEKKRFPCPENRLSTIIIWKCRRLRWTGHVDRAQETRNAHRVMVGKTLVECVILKGDVVRM
jgi:hypothetical protein